MNQVKDGSNWESLILVVKTWLVQLIVCYYIGLQTSLTLQILLGTTDLVGVHESTCSWLVMCVYEMVVYDLKSFNM